MASVGHFIFFEISTMKSCILIFKLAGLVYLTPCKTSLWVQIQNFSKAKMNLLGLLQIYNFLEGFVIQMRNWFVRKMLNFIWALRTLFPLLC